MGCQSSNAVPHWQRSAGNTLLGSRSQEPGKSLNSGTAAPNRATPNMPDSKSENSIDTESTRTTAADDTCCHQESWPPFSQALLEASMESSVDTARTVQSSSGAGEDIDVLATKLVCKRKEQVLRKKNFFLLLQDEKQRQQYEKKHNDEGLML